MKNKSLILLIISVFLVLVSCKSSDTITVFSGGETEYSIITAEGASDEAKTLAKELQSLSGASPELLTDASAEEALEILIGDTNRAATAKYIEKLQAASTVSAFHYIIAEDGGKLVILSDSDIGYVYALDYIKTAYIDGGVFTIPSGTYDIKQVIWDDYYASDYYNDRLLAEADKNRYEEGNKLFDNEMNRYEDTEENTIMTVGEAIKQYKGMVANFITADFGEYTASTFKNANKYTSQLDDGDWIEPGTAHPRVLFTTTKLSDEKSSLERVRENLTADENSIAYRRYIALSDSPCDGRFTKFTGSGDKRHNYDAEIVSKIEAKAFRYVMERDPVKYPNADDDPASLYGYEAIYAAKNAMLTINVPHTVGDWCRTYGFLMYTVACVYDWCYELLETEDKNQFINGGVNLLGKHLEMVCYVGAANKVPLEQGAAYGHGAEDQLLVDYLSFAIAVYNEAPEIYELVAGRILTEYTDMQNYLYKSGSYWEGSQYGAVRGAATVMSNFLFNRMTDGKETPFDIKAAAITSTYYVRPDGQPYRIGDIDENYKTLGAKLSGIVNFYAGNLYEDAYLKSFAYTALEDFNYFKIGVAGLTPVQFLATNNPEVSHVYAGTAPLTNTASYPVTSIIAKSANNDKNAFGLYMSMPENYVASHAHMECGTFQIIYNGSILASHSGAYTSWGDAHHMGYSMQTVSTNSLLIYKPSLAGTYNSNKNTMIYTGGQTIEKSTVIPNTLSQLLSHERLNQCTSLGVANVEVGGKYLYSYMGGDMTKAYDAGTVDEVTRYMLCVATDNESCPYVFVVFDRIKADDASYKKSALIHVQDEPTVLGGYYALTDTTDGKLVEIGSANSDNYAIITNGDGRLVVQSVGYDTDYTIIGGEGYDCWIAGVDENKNYSLEDGQNLPHNKQLVEGSLAEYGWGRIEISPAEAAKTDYMLTVMYVTDADNHSRVKAEDICSDTLAGSMLFGKAVLFPKNESLLKTEASFTLTKGGECFVGGISAGAWNVMNGDNVVGEITVEAGKNLISFTAENAGTYTLKPVNLK